MGLIADFVVATPQDAIRYESLLQEGKAVPPERYARAEYKNFTPLALGMLWAILSHEAWNGERHQFHDISHTGNGKTWLLRFPDEFVTLLATFDAASDDQIAAAWIATGEVRGTHDNLKSVLRDLKHLAIRTRDGGRYLYLWGSL